MIEVVVAGLGVIPPASDPLLLLKEREGGRVLPINIGPLEAQAIALPLEGMHPPRPMTHDVFAEVMGRLGGHPRRVEITHLAEGAFHARLVLAHDGAEDADDDFDMRPSDAVALAVRTQAPIYVAEAVMAEAGVETETVDEDEVAATEASEEEDGVELDESKLAPFREFIETLDTDSLDKE